MLKSMSHPHQALISTTPRRAAGIRHQVFNATAMQLQGLWELAKALASDVGMGSH